ncbi:MAG: hypothetical protein LBJ22_06450, partial [Synergistaceae bacterium]|nr:hypothetical protein [Synergistaceae bacterium]
MARRKDESSSSRYRNEELMEREFEERVEAKRRRSPLKNKGKPKPPILLRVLTWCGVILLCFVGGYIGTSYMLKLLEKPIFYKPEDGVQAENRGGALLSSDSAADLKLDMQKVVLSLFYPKEGALVEERAEVIAHTREDNIREAVLRLLARSGLFDGAVDVQHVFRNVDMVYL